MEIVTPQEFIEKPVIDIDVEFIGAPGMRWTINDVLETKFVNDSLDGMTFCIAETGHTVHIPTQNVAWYSVRYRIDRIPVKKPLAQAQDR